MAPCQGVQAMKGGWSGLIVKFLVVGIMLAASHHMVHYEPAKYVNLISIYAI